MKISKRILSLFLACLFCLGSLAACSGSNTPGSDTEPSDTTGPSSSVKWPEVEGTVIYVDAAAEDGGNGTEEAPFKNVPDAQAKIREIKSGEGLPEGGITVLLASGNYPLMDTITFTAEDSGAEGRPITYMAVKKNEATLTGGVTLDPADFVHLDENEKAIINDKAAKDKVLKVDLSGYGITAEALGEMRSSANNYNDDGTASFYIGDNRLHLSRYPNLNAEDPYLRTGANDGTTNFDIFAMLEFEEQAVAIKERGKNWDLDNLWAAGFFMVESSFSSSPVTEIDIEKLNVTLSEKPYYGIGTLKKIYFFNLLSETDSPGEYYIDRENMILYLYPTDNFDSSSVVISLSDKNIATADNLSYVNFSGINFTATQMNGLYFTSCDHITIENCEVTKTGMDGIYADGTNITIQNNELRQIGYHGIEILGGDITTLNSSNNLVYNNHIYKAGQAIKSSKYAVRIRGCGAMVSHNEIHETPHKGIDYEGPNHVIEYNEIYNVCMDTGDCGAIQAKRTFDSYGCIIRYNFIHDIGGPGSWALGIYWDDGLSGQTAYGNIVANVTAHGMNVGGGRDNVVENNIFINWASKDHALHYDNRARDYADDIGGGQEEQTVNMANRLADLQKQQEWLDAFPGYGDIIPYTYDYAGDRDDPMLSCNPANAVIKNNIACRTDPTKYDASYFTTLFDVEKMLGTYENNFEVQDSDHTFIPGYENGDFTIAEDSEVFANGFVRIPLEEIGRVTND